MIHAKTGVFDRGLALVGTANLDARSLRLNFEVIAAAYDEPLNEQLAALFLRDCSRAANGACATPPLAPAQTVPERGQTARAAAVALEAPVRSASARRRARGDPRALCSSARTTLASGPFGGLR